MSNKSQIQPLTVYNLEEASNLLDIDRKTTYQLIKQGELPAKKVGKGYKLLGEHLVNFMGSATITPQSMQPNFTAPANVGAVSNNPNMRWEPNKNNSGAVDNRIDKLDK